MPILQQVVAPDQQPVSLLGWGAILVLGVLLWVVLIAFL